MARNPKVSEGADGPNGVEPLGERLVVLSVWHAPLASVRKIEGFREGPEAYVIVPPRSSAVPSDAAETAPTMRNRHLQIVAERGRMAWQKTSGYNWRALVEADISRFERVIGDGLRSRTYRRR